MKGETQMRISGENGYLPENLNGGQKKNSIFGNEKADFATVFRKIADNKDNQNVEVESAKNIYLYPSTVDNVNNIKAKEIATLMREDGTKK